VGGEDAAVVDAGELVLDVSVRRQDQSLHPPAGLQPLDMLGAHRVQQRQPVGAAQRQHVAVTEIDPAVPGFEPALLGDRVAVVPGDARIDAAPVDRPGEGQQRRAHQCSSDTSAQSTQRPKTVR
jgi:hypothetical protein